MATRSHEGLETLYRKTDKHDFESTTNRSSSTSQQYYTACKPGRITKEAMRVSLERRYPPPPVSRNARGEAKHDRMKRPTGVGSRNTVRSFTQPFTLSAQTSHYERTPRYPSRTSTNPGAGQQVSHQMSPLGVSRHPEYEYTPCYSPTTGRKSSPTACISPKLEPRYESGYYSPPSMTEPCQIRAVYVHDCRDTQTKGNARKPVTDTEKPLPPLQPERIDHRFFEQRYRDGKASYPEAKEWSSNASDEQYGRYQQKPESLSSRNNLLRPAMFVDAPTSPSVSSTKTAREQRRSLPKSDVQGDSDKEYLDVDEVEEEITCPM
ncbi:hypothetical protein QFC21_001297 [Naganishia friedmannii]|uniref:Uncharacterized protein n=1 Tax=Naganishia friedmannii TaxID=89922 RepID=A0ACC2W4M7_9TREE|nr:hypothetical protein QFC21_001297 [Naganishia friedmannii]